MKFMPASTQASSRRNDSVSSTVQPKTLPPRQSGETRRSDRPSRRSEEGFIEELLQERRRPAGDAAPPSVPGKNHGGAVLLDARRVRASAALRDGPAAAAAVSRRVHVLPGEHGQQAPVGGRFEAASALEAGR